MVTLEWLNPTAQKASVGAPHLECGAFHIGGGPGAATAVAALHDDLPTTLSTGPAAAAGRVVRVEVRVDPGAGLPPEGYTLTTRCDAVLITGADPAGAFYGAQTLIWLVAAPCAEHALCVPAADVRDWPDLPLRGTIEGFYGVPWSHADRLEHLRFSGRHKLNAYVYAPKDDPYHRERWREPYPEAELARLAELVAEAAARHVRFVFALSPGLSMVYGDPAERAALRAKAAQVWEAGVREFALLFDDIPAELEHERDRAAFGTAPGASASAHAAVCRDFTEAFLEPRGAERPLTMVPTDYAGTSRTAYRDRLAEELPPGVLVWWTGRDVVVGTVTADEIAAAAASYGHRVALWDNFPVNDFDFTRVFLGPLTGRDTRLDDVALAGVTANPMVHAAASRLALATVADYAWQPAAYDAARSHGRALRLVPGAAELAPLVEVCSSWPPSADQSPTLSALCASVLADADADAAAVRPGGEFVTGVRLRRELERLAALPASSPGRIGEELRPWVAAARDMATAALAALDLLTTLPRATGNGTAARTADETARAAKTARATETPRTAAEAPARAVSEEARAVAEALARAEAHEANVLRGVLPPFVRAVLDRAAPAATPPAPAVTPPATAVTHPAPAVTPIHATTMPGFAPGADAAPRTPAGP
ncbi:beta-N-acetylglucosaminidase domain-containing protein, partial [Nonomuraea sp. RK-328]|nr:beta-N-acetylglucosaminidase domain-containing protein [Nonomuraea sp. RK-328]